MSRQINALRHGPEIVVGCPGRVLDLLQQKALRLGDVDTLVLDGYRQCLPTGIVARLRPDGALDQFVVDPYQGGAGTSTNMNTNEVMANVALELTGHPLGAYEVIEPHDHLNMSQSTNDSYPTALKVAMLAGNDRVAAEARELVAALRDQGNAFLKIVKMGRTELQDAVPMTVGQEFHAFAAALETEIDFLRAAEKPLLTINMGATAIGTGINSPPGYADRVTQKLSDVSGFKLRRARNLVEATQNAGDVKRHAGGIQIKRGHRFSRK